VQDRRRTSDEQLRKEACNDWSTDLDLPLHSAVGECLERALLSEGTKTCQVVDPEDPRWEGGDWFSDCCELGGLDTTVTHAATDGYDHAAAPSPALGPGYCCWFPTNDQSAHRAASLGESGVGVLENGPLAELQKAILLVLAGKSYYSPELANCAD